MALTSFLNDLRLYQIQASEGLFERLKKNQHFLERFVKKIEEDK